MLRQTAMKCVFANVMLKQGVLTKLQTNENGFRINVMLRLILTLCCLALLVTLFTLSRCHIKGWRWTSTTSITSPSAFLITLDSDNNSTPIESINDIDVPMSNELEPIFVNTSLPIVNPHPFRYVINCPNICKMATFEEGVGRVNGSAEIFVLNYVHSAVDHFEKRHRIRATWANESMYQLRGPNGETVRVKTVFFTGLSVEKPYLQAALRDESKLYGDIVQEDFHDSYR